MNKTIAEKFKEAKENFIWKYQTIRWRTVLNSFSAKDELEKFGEIFDSLAEAFEPEPEKEGGHYSTQERERDNILWGRESKPEIEVGDEAELLFEYFKRGEVVRIYQRDTHENKDVRFAQVILKVDLPVKNLTLIHKRKELGNE